MPKNAPGYAVSANVCIILAWGSLACQATLCPAPSNQSESDIPSPAAVHEPGYSPPGIPRPFGPWTLAGRPHERSLPIRGVRTLGSDRISTGLLRPHRGARPHSREQLAADSPMAPLALHHPGERSNPRPAPDRQPADEARKIHATPCPDDGITRIDAHRCPWCTPAKLGTAGLGG